MNMVITIGEKSRIEKVLEKETFRVEVEREGAGGGCEEEEEIPGRGGGKDVRGSVETGEIGEKKEGLRRSMETVIGVPFRLIVKDFSVR